jgi:uncharacterized protein (DUF4415 family)
MKSSEKGRAVLIEGVVYERKSDGTLVPHEDLTDYARLDAMTEADIEQASLSDADDVPMTDEEWLRGSIKAPTKVPVGLKLDQDVLDWFRANGRGYQTRMNAVLRKYMEAHRKAG